MSKLDDFLGNDPHGLEGRGEGRLFETIGRTRIDVVWQAFLWDKATHSVFARKYFPFDPSMNGAQMEAKQDCAKFIEESGYAKSAFPQVGFLITIPEETNLTDDNVTWDIEEFVNSFDSTKSQMGENGNLDEEQQKEVKNDLPYEALIKSLKGHGDILGEWILAKTAQITNELTRVQGKMNKSGYDFKTRVLVEIYATEQEAYKAAGMNSDDTPVVDFEDTPTLTLSDTAHQQSWTIETLTKEKDSLLAMINEARLGLNTPNKESYSYEQAVDFVCKQYMVEPSDLTLIQIPLAEEEIVF